MNPVIRVQFWTRNGDIPASVDIERTHRDRSYERVTRASARRLASVCRFEVFAGDFRASVYANGWGVSRIPAADAQPEALA